MAQRPQGKAKSKPTARVETNAKTDDLKVNTKAGDDQALTTNQGLKVNDDQNSLKMGERGPSLLEDFILREKITHFDHERIPERVVHARGVGAHGYFQPYKNAAGLSKAGFLQDPNQQTPVFVRISTVAGSRGSTDLARDVRGFAVKFYTNEGNFDLVGNNIPVFFIQDTIKFPDLIHAVKPEPHNEIPQAASAHDTFWDFISLLPESMHMIMWVMSDRAIPRSLRMMEGFGIHTFRFINAKNQSSFVKFHWKPKLGTHGVLWDEALKISGNDPDFHRRDLFEAIESGSYPEWELGVQVVAEKDADSFDFDLTDPTKLIPEELVPVTLIGKMVLNRNPDNYFAEVEQVAFHPGHVVPGIDFSNDPLLQGRLFSYTDTQLTRLGGPNFHEIPINRAISPMHNNQRDGHMRQEINKGKTAYQPNSIGGGCPFQSKMVDGGFTSFPEPASGIKVRGRGPKFFDHYTQARMFFQSVSEPEQMHIIKALTFELSKVETVAIRERMITQLRQIDRKLVEGVAEALRLDPDLEVEGMLNQAVPADIDPKKYQSKKPPKAVVQSPALRMIKDAPSSVATRKVAILAADGVDSKEVDAWKGAMMQAGVICKIVAPNAGYIKTQSGTKMPVDFTFLNSSSVLFDALFVPTGEASVTALTAEPNAVRFVMEAFRHCKTLAASGEGKKLFATAGIIANAAPAPAPTGKKGDKSAQPSGDPGVLMGEGPLPSLGEAFLGALAKHRHWAREKGTQPPV